MKTVKPVTLYKLVVPNYCKPTAISQGDDGYIVALKRDYNSSPPSKKIKPPSLYPYFFGVVLSMLKKINIYICKLILWKSNPPSKDVYIQDMSY